MKYTIFVTNIMDKNISLVISTYVILKNHLMKSVMDYYVYSVR